MKLKHIVELVAVVGVLVGLLAYAEEFDIAQCFESRSQLQECCANGSVSEEKCHEVPIQLTKETCEATNHLPTLLRCCREGILETPHHCEEAVTKLLEEKRPNL